MANDKPVLVDQGRIVATPGAIEQVSNEDLAALFRDSTGDWGDVDDEDRTANDDALRNGGHDGRHPALDHRGGRPLGDDRDARGRVLRTV